jgi:hypothetical protein
MRVILLSLLLVAQFGLGDWSARHTWKASWKSKPVVVMEDGSQLPTIDSIYASHGTLALPSGRDYFDSGIPDSWQFAASYPLSNLVQQSDNFISLNLPPSLVVLGEDIWLLAVVSPYVLNCTPPKTGNELRVANYGSECPNETKRSRLIFTFSAP